MAFERLASMNTVSGSAIVWYLHSYSDNQSVCRNWPYAMDTIPDISLIDVARDVGIIHFRIKS